MTLSELDKRSCPPIFIPTTEMCQTRTKSVSSFFLALFLTCSLLHTVLLEPPNPLVLEVLGFYNRPSLEYTMKLAIECLNDPTQRDFSPLAHRTHDSREIRWNITMAFTGDSANKAKDLANELFPSSPNIIGGIGPALSLESAYISPVATKYKKPLISYSATSTIFSNKLEHPYFARTIAADDQQTQAMADLLYVYEARSVVTIATNESYGVFGVKELKKKLQRKGISVQKDVYFMTNESPDKMLEELKNTGVTTIVSIIASNTARINLLKSAAQKNMLSSGYIWILSESFTNIILENEETKEARLLDPSLNEYAQGLIYLKPSGGTWSKKKYLYKHWYEHPHPYGHPAPVDESAFDAILTYGYAIYRMIDERESDFNPYHGDDLLGYIKKSDFIGVSGYMRIDEKGDRIGTPYQIVNIVGGKASIFAQWDVFKGLEIESDPILLGNVSIRNYFPNGIPLMNIRTSEDTWIPLLTPPSSRYSFTLTLSTSHDSLMLFGGRDQRGNVLSDLWTFDFTSDTWKMEHPASGLPPERRDHVAFTLDDDFYIFGGYNERYHLGDMWRFSVKTNQWFPVLSMHNDDKIPSPRSSMAVAQIVESGEVYLFGGEDAGGYRNDLWLYHSHNRIWEHVTPTDGGMITPRSFHCMGSMGRILVVWGGMGLNGEQLQDLWSFDIDTLKWKKMNINNRIPARVGASCAIFEQYLIVGNGWDMEENVMRRDVYYLYLEDIGNQSSVFHWDLLVREMPETYTGRYLTPFQIFDTMIVWFGGKGQSEIFSDLWFINTVGGRFERVHDSIFGPEGMADTTASMIGDTIYLFGGLNSRLKADNLLFKFNTSSKSWDIIISRPTSSGYPQKRFQHCCVAIANQLFVFFGKTENEDYLSDIWMYTTSQNEWRDITAQIGGEKPLPRAGASGYVYNDTCIVIYGGYNNAFQFDEILLYDIESTRFTIIQAKTSLSPFPFTISPQIAVMKENLIVVGGQDHTENTNSQIFSFNFTTGLWTKQKRFIKISKAIVAPLSETHLLVFGGRVNLTLSNSLWLIDLESDQSHTLIEPAQKHLSKFGIPMPRDGHVGIVGGDRIFIFGGYGQINSRKSKSIVYSDIWEFRFSSICNSSISESKTCLPCTKGYFSYYSSCLPCRRGTYSDGYGSSCKQCLSGFYSTQQASQFIGLCSPCPHGTYNDIPGSEICKPCNVSEEFCPIASSNPIDFGDQHSLLYSSHDFIMSTPVAVQPLPLERKDARNSLLSIISFTSAAMVGVILSFLFLFTFRRFGPYYRKFDMFKTRHYMKVGPIHIRKTPLGGLFTFIFYTVMIAFLITAIVPRIDDSYIEDRTLVPNLTVKETVTGNIEAEVAFVGYPGLCLKDESQEISKKNTTTPYGECSKGISVSLMRISPDHQGYITSMCRRLPQHVIRSCAVKISCKSCYFDNMDSGDIMFMLAEPYSYAIGFTYNITSSSSYEGQNSSISGTIMSHPSKLFRGGVGRQSTTVLFDVYQTIYDDLTDSRKYATGYHIGTRSSQIGSQVDSQRFGEENGVGFVFRLSLTANSMLVRVTQRQTWPLFIGTTLGSISGFIGVFGLILSQFERGRMYFYRFKDYLSKRFPVVKRKMKSQNQKIETNNGTELNEILLTDFKSNGSGKDKDSEKIVDDLFI